MKNLILIRHAQAAHFSPGTGEDTERSLTERGLEQARHLALFARKQLPNPQLAMCSPAKRTMQTLEVLKNSMKGFPGIQLRGSLYNASLQPLIGNLTETDDEIRTLLICGHNPGIGHLQAYLTGELRHFSPSATAWLELECDTWQEVTREIGTLRKFQDGF